MKSKPSFIHDWNAVESRPTRGLSLNSFYMKQLALKYLIVTIGENMPPIFCRVYAMLSKHTHFAACATIWAVITFVIFQIPRSRYKHIENDWGFATCVVTDVDKSTANGHKYVVGYEVRYRLDNVTQTGRAPAHDHGGQSYEVLVTKLILEYHDSNHFLFIIIIIR